MSDFEIDKIIQNTDTSIPSCLEDRILNSSSRALTRSFIIRKTVKRTISALAITIICFGAFMTGQFSEKKKTGGPEYANINSKDTITITVQKDLLAWIDAGHFFNQLDMKDKANEAYGKAISLIPISDQIITSKNTQKERNSFYEFLNDTEFSALNTMAMINR